VKPRDIFLTKLTRGDAARPAVGSATSIVTTDLMDKVGAWFPEANLNAETMATLAAAGYTELGFDNVMPLFGVWHESAALGCKVDWGTKGRMPDCRLRLYNNIEEKITIPPDFLKREPCAIPLKALELLKRRYGDDVAVVGKVFGPWTLGYHLFGVQEFLICALTEPDSVKRAMRSLIEVTVQFGNAQIEAGADALTLADHATRDLCGPEFYRDFLVEMHQELSQRLKCPLILHICGDTSDRIEYIRKTGVECFHYDSKVPAATARELAGDKLSLMGGTSNFAIVRNGNREDIVQDVKEKQANCIDIIGPECAVPLDAPCQNLKWIADEVKQ
jgi:MtaA/CmuA family methyltransferase